MTEDKLLNVVLVSYNTCALTLDCLRALSLELRITGRNVILVDNNSSDETISQVRNEFPEVEIIANTCNLGFGAANNIGFSICDCEYVLLLNTDTVVRPGSLKSMVELLECDLTLGAVGCRLENADGTLQRSCWSFPTPLRAWWEALGVNRLGLSPDWHRWDHLTEQDVDFVIGAALMVRSKVIEQVGGFDEDFFLYAEEADWQRRMANAKWRVRYTPKATIMHLGGASSVTLRDRQLVESCRGTRRYILKHHGRVGLFIFRLGVILGCSLRVVFYLVQSTARPSAKLKSFELLRVLRWWCGIGPRVGIRELCSLSKSGAQR